ncbi:conserved hypothetical protein (plasmid) [Rhodospirillum rubrum ATCC 11170]|uniref:Transposase IS200-like domain-containing protein n=1 Tax=Rhodospirillum rubrum (strain ATCC 11170 / ATH 1.1.1 / DSM 467 / LMG 4362 / NCIMB 8255 / S1) TaxID=269796 RepID=Q2RML6_RHORT|nr:transposase [Rhodospirillum rubrum]ABC24629.1 conserved hypothetical protein [Rhodospirillum rubrum ATCC 11170]QXG82491.1 transposase [Rhodospirillum rubrum]
MPRRPRLDLPGVPQHVVQRGVDRQPVFFCEEDRAVFLHWLGAALARRGLDLHAYCLMTNHIHLLVSAPSSADLGAVMQDMGRRYGQYVNRQRQRFGGLWQGRYKAGYIQDEAYLLACMRYIELNPVRAGMVADPAAYRWSSYRANALGAANALVTPHEVYRQLAADADGRARAYRALVSDGVADDPAWDLIRLATGQGALIGEAGFAERIGRDLGHSVTPRPRGRPRKDKTSKTE